MLIMILGYVLLVGTFIFVYINIGPLACLVDIPTMVTVLMGILSILLIMASKKKGCDLNKINDKNNMPPNFNCAKYGVYVSILVGILCSLLHLLMILADPKLLQILSSERLVSNSMSIVILPSFYGLLMAILFYAVGAAAPVFFIGQGGSPARSGRERKRIGIAAASTGRKRRHEI